MDNQNALEQHRVIILATIDYFLENTAGRVIVDKDDTVGKYYEKLKGKAEKHYRDGNLKLLQRVMREIGGLPRLMQDDSYITFIEERTGYDAEILKPIVPGNSPDNKSKRVIINEGDIIHKGLTEKYSPDNKRKFTVWEIARPDRPVVTHVDIHFGKSGASVYMVEGANLDINVYWKDNNTIIIETRNDYDAISKHGEQYQSLDDVVRVEYVVR